jgi:hypothetical protein
MYYTLNVFEEWGQKIKAWWETLDPVNVWGTILLIVSISMLLVLILFTEYKREERDSMKFSLILILIIAICGGFGFHMILISNGW